MSKSNRTILVICLFLLILGLKLGHLSADPPTQLSWSGGLFGDEGAHAHNARNKVLFGQWITDDWNPMFYNPFLTLGEYVSFLLLKPGLKQVRLVVIIITFLGQLLLYRALRQIDFGIALLASFLLGFNYIYLMYSRLGLTDSFMSAALLLAFFFWQKGIEKEKFLFLGGVAIFATYVCKSTAIYFIIAAIISLFFALIQKGAERPKRRLILSLGYFFSGLIFAFLLWLFLFYLPNQSYFSAYRQTWFRKALPESWERLWENWQNLRIFYFAKTPVVLLTPLFYLPFFLYTLLGDGKKVYPAEFFAWLWWAGGILFLSSLNYNPLRYFISVVPASCLVTAFALKRLWQGQVFPKRKPKLIFWILASIWVLVVISVTIKFFTTRQLVTLLFFLAISIFLVYMVYYLFLEVFFVKKRKTEINFPPVRLLVLAIILVSFLINGYRYFQWFIHPQYTVINTSREIGQLLDKAYIAGLWAPLVCLENSHRALYLGEGNERETFSRYPVTHLFLWDGNNREELRNLEKNYLEVMKRAEQIKVYTIKELPVRLFEIVNTDRRG